MIAEVLAPLVPVVLVISLRAPKVFWGAVFLSGVFGNLFQPGIQVMPTLPDYLFWWEILCSLAFCFGLLFAPRPDFGRQGDS